jgi:hypothetical protein
MECGKECAFLSVLVFKNINDGGGLIVDRLVEEKFLMLPRLRCEFAQGEV